MSGGSDGVDCVSEGRESGERDDVDCVSEGRESVDCESVDCESVDCDREDCDSVWRLVDIFCCPNQHYKIRNCCTIDRIYSMKLLVCTSETECPRQCTATYSHSAMVEIPKSHCSRCKNCPFDKGSRTSH